MEKGELPKKIVDFMPLDFFSRYFQYTVFGIDKVIGLDGTMNAPGYIYIMALDIQDSHHNAGYDFVTHIVNVMHNEIVAAQKGDGEFQVPPLLVNANYSL